MAGPLLRTHRTIHARNEFQLLGQYARTARLVCAGIMAWVAAMTAMTAMTGTTGTASAQTTSVPCILDEYLGTHDTQGAAWDVMVVGSVAYVADGSSQAGR